MTATSRRAVLTAPRRFETTSFAVADPAPGQLTVDVHGCGVCGSNLPVWSGRPWFRYPLPPGAPGHEGWGTVTAVGDDGSSVGVGQHVAFLAEDAFAETVDVPADRVIALPDALAGAAFPGEALGCGFNVAVRSRFEAGQTVAIVGLGFLGAVVARLAVRAGAQVIAISRRPDGLDVARRFGAGATLVDDGEQPIADVVGEMTDGAGCAVVVEAAGVQHTLDLASAVTAEGGRLVIAGYHQDGTRTVDMQSWNWRGIDVVNAHERDPEVALRGMRAAAEAVAEGWLDLEPLITHRVGLDDLDAAMAMMEQRPPGFMKSVMVR
jgi:2-desacetyl-2-hydroxyethyl bacteriochlorophyllide A dehydrogenase